MGENDAVTVWTSFRESPARMGLFVVGPILLAIGQLLNAVVAGLPLWAAGAFAAAMVAYAVLFAQLQVTQLRVDALEATATRAERGTSS